MVDPIKKPPTPSSTLPLSLEPLPPRSPRQTQKASSVPSRPQKKDVARIELSSSQSGEDPEELPHPLPERKARFRAGYLALFTNRV
jgi:hypothetical protein